MQEDRRSIKVLPVSSEALVLSMLKDFYSVGTLEELVLAQDRHIECLQLKLRDSGAWYDRPMRTIKIRKLENAD